MIALWFLLACSDPVEVPPGPLPSDSLYQLDVDLVDQHGRAVDLAVHRGHPAVVSMFYASCGAACPMLVEDIKAFEARLSPAERDDLRVLLVSLDPAQDTPEALADTVSKREIDDARWVLARPKPDDVRPIAALLGISYRPASEGMDHSSILVLVDAEGRPIARIEGLRQDPTPLVEALRVL